MRNIWYDLGRNGSALSGPDFSWRAYSVGFTHGYSCCSPPANANAYPRVSAKRMTMNSRGCKPTEQRSEINATLKGSNRGLVIDRVYLEFARDSSAPSGPGF